MPSTLTRRGVFLTALFASLAVADRAPAQESVTLRLARRLEVLPGARHPLANDNGKISFLVPLGASDDPRDLGLRWVAPGIAGGVLDPDALFSFADDHPDRFISITPRLQPNLEFARKKNGILGYRASLEAAGQGMDAGRGEGVVVGVVDTGIDITHPAFLDEEGHTRIAWLLTWGLPNGKYPELEDEFGCTEDFETSCAIFDAEDIDELLTKTKLRDDVHDMVGHGTHVASIAAGNGQRGNDKPPINAGMAPGATLVIASPSQSGGFGDREVLLGTKFVFDRAEAMGMPAVVNLSLGGDFGPHDGTSMLEQGTADFVGDDKPGRVIVVAAGNSGGLFRIDDVEPLGIHTEAHVEEHADVEVPVFVPSASGGEIFIWVTFRPDDEVSVGLDGPDGDDWVSLVGPGEESGYNTDEVTAAVINNLVNEHSSITSETNSAVVAFSGKWPENSQFTVHLSGKGDAQMWVVGQGDATAGAYFVQATKEGTINQPASHPRLLAVGCTVNRDKWVALDAGSIIIEEFGEGPLEVDGACYFSAAGPTPLGVPKPELSAPGAFVVGAMGVDADPRGGNRTMFSGDGCPDNTECFVVDDRYAIATGTSMSAPMVTGAVALLLEQEPSLTQAEATEILQAAARKPGGAVPYGSQIGVGALDVTHALAVLAEEGTKGKPPDRGKSWWFMSAESVRPDPSWSAIGNVELRRADGSIASGLDGSLLSVEVEGGSLVKSPTKVRHGLFQFAVAGRRGDGGGAVTVRVLYDGKQIGDVLTMPVAIDEWAANDSSAKAGGAFSCGLGGAHVPSETALGLGLGAAALLLRGSRRRRRTIAGSLSTAAAGVATTSPSRQPLLRPRSEPVAGGDAGKQG